MARRKTGNGRPDPPPSPASLKVEELLATLRKYHEIGLRAIGKTADGADREPTPIATLAGEADVSVDTIRRATTFARLYGKADLDELLSLRDASGSPLSWYMVRVLIQVADKGRRAELQRRAAAEGWSREDLRDEVDALDGSTRRAGKVGRKFAIPRSPAHALRRLVAQCESWLRFYENLGGDGGLAYQMRLAAEASDRPADLVDLIRQARSRLREVQEAAGKVADQLAKAEPELKVKAISTEKVGDQLAKEEQKAKEKSTSTGKVADKLANAEPKPKGKVVAAIEIPEAKKPSRGS